MSVADMVETEELVLVHVRWYYLSVAVRELGARKKIGVPFDGGFYVPAEYADMLTFFRLNLSGHVGCRLRADEWKALLKACLDPAVWALVQHDPNEYISTYLGIEFHE